MTPVYALGDSEPDIHPEAYVHPDAVVIGNVTIGAESSVWPTAVLRGDDGRIEVGARTSIQDGSIIHTTAWEPTIIGDEVTIGHNVHIEAAVIGNRALISSGSVVLNGSSVGEGAVVAAGAVVSPRMQVAPLTMVMGIPARVREGFAVNPDLVQHAVDSYLQRGKRFRAELRVEADGAQAARGDRRGRAGRRRWSRSPPVIADDGRLPARRDRRRPPLPAGRGERAARVPAALRRRPGADRRPGPVPDARARDRAVVLGGAGDPAAARAAWSTSSASTPTDLGPPDAVQRRPDAVDRAGRAAAQQGAHRGAGRARARTADKGWEEVTEQAIRALVARDGAPLVAILWGRDARNLRPAAGRRAAVESAHPCPMSADRGFFGSRPFSRANELLVELGGEPVDWKLP